MEQHFIELGDKLYTIFVTPRNFIIILSAWAFALIVGHISIGMMQFIKTPSKVAKWRVLFKASIAPAIYLVFCSIAVWLSGTRPGLQDGQTELASGTGLDGTEIGFRVGLGIILTLSCWLLPVFTMWASKKWLPAGLHKALQKIL